MKIYLAGPLFSIAERSFNATLAAALRDLGHEVFLPQEHESAIASHIFHMDVCGIDWAEVIVVCADGADPDSGTAWECGYAYAKGKPIILYRTDFRAADESGEVVNLMLTCSAAHVIRPQPMGSGRDTVRWYADEINRWLVALNQLKEAP